MAARRALTMAGTMMMAMAVACKGDPPAPPAEPAAPPAPSVMSADERMKWYQDCWELFNTKNWEPFKACYANEIVSDDVDSGRPTASGADAVVAAAREQAVGFPDMKGTPQIIMSNGNRFASLYLLTGTNSGAFNGPDGKPIPATNKKFGFMFAHVIETTDGGGKAVSERSYSDAGTLFYQLGLSPAPARAVMESGAATPAIVVASNSEVESKNVEAFRAGMERFNQRDLKGFEGFNAPDAVYHDFTQPHDISGKENTEMLAGFLKAFPDCKLTATATWGAGDYVVNEGVFEGTNTGAFPAMGIKEATQKPVKVRFVEFARYENGKIKEDWLLFNTLSMASQLGMMEP